MSVSKLLKYRSISKIDSKGKRYQVGLVVRENGRFEVYSDFMLVNEYINPDYQCIDVEADFNQFYLRFVSQSSTVEPGMTLDDIKDQL